MILKEKGKYRLVKSDKLIKKIDKDDIYYILKTSFKFQVKLDIPKFNIWITFKEIIDETGNKEDIKFNELNAIELFNTIINV